MLSILKVIERISLLKIWRSKKKKNQRQILRNKIRSTTFSVDSTYNTNVLSFLSSWKPVSFSRRTLLHGVSKKDLTFSWRYIWRVRCYWTWHRTVWWKETEVSKEHAAFLFTVAVCPEYSGHGFLRELHTDQTGPDQTHHIAPDDKVLFYFGRGLITLTLYT